MISKNIRDWANEHFYTLINDKDKIDFFSIRLNEYVYVRLKSDPQTSSFVEKLEREAQDQSLVKQCTDTNEMVHTSNDLLQGIKKKIDTLAAETPARMSPASATSPSAKDIDDVITDDNLYFLDKYEYCESRPGSDRKLSRLFLDQDRYIPLKDVYVDPVLKDGRLFPDFLNDWVTLPEYDENGNATIASARLLVLFGKAGIGKSSLVAKLVSEPSWTSSTIHAIALRRHKEMFQSNDPWLCVLKVLNCKNQDELRQGSGSIIIMDGLDELCVFDSDFDSTAFLNNLCDNIPSGIRLIITSRELQRHSNLIISFEKIALVYLMWNEEQAIQWCENYANAWSESDSRRKINILNWTSNFPMVYRKLNSELQEIFCVPIILYIACHENIDLSQAKTRGEIYDQSFRKIAMRTYGSFLLPVELRNDDNKRFKILWQLTKEIAYQMFLTKKLDQALDTTEIASAIMAAKLDLALAESELDLEKLLGCLPAVFHFASGDSHGIEFAHLSVSEYFTAVKLYEDYFQCIDTSAEYDMVWHNIYEAFRYRQLPESIFDYLNAMPGKAMCEVGISQLNFDRFSEIYKEGMKKQQILLQTAQPYDYPDHKPHWISEEITNIFSNLTYFLTGHNFDNKETTDASNNTLKMYLMERCMVNMSAWRLNLVHLEGAVLYGAHLEGAHLNAAYLEGARLSDAHLEGAHLNDAHLEGAHLDNAHLEGAYLERVHLQHAYLEGAHLVCTHLTQAYLHSALLTNADLYAVDLCGADLSMAELNNACLCDVYLINANLSKAKLIKAVLSCSNLNAANLYGTDFTDAVLIGCSLEQVCHDKETIWKGAKYCLDPRCPTLFPEDFDPKVQGMIEVDLTGNPI